MNMSCLRMTLAASYLVLTLFYQQKTAGALEDPGSSGLMQPFSNEVETDRTSKVAAVLSAQEAGSASLGGAVFPPGAGVQVVLFGRGREVAKTTTGADGRFEFSSLPAGEYVLHTSYPGYASDPVEVRLSGAHSGWQDVRLLYISAIDGVDWTRGTIHASGRGAFPPSAANIAASREMARRAALSEAERNLLLAVEQIRLDPDHELKALMESGTYSVRLRGYVRGFRVVSEREVNGGMEVELELPLAGPAGLMRLLAE